MKSNANKKNSIKNLQIGLKANSINFFYKDFNKRISLCLISFNPIRKRNSDLFWIKIDYYDNPLCVVFVS